MVGLDHVRIAGADVLLGAVAVADAHRAGLQHPDVAVLAALAADDRFDALGPAPAGGQRHPRRGRTPEADDLDPSLVRSPGLVRGIESARFDTCHRSLLL